MLTIISKKHVAWETFDNEEREVVRLWIAVTSSSDLPTKRSIPGLTLQEGSRAWDISGAKNYGWTENGVWNEQPSGGGGTIPPDIVVIKGTVSSVSQLPSNAQPGWLYFVGLPTDEAYSEYVYTIDERWEFIGYNQISVDDALSTTSENPVQNKIITTALGTKVDKVTGKGLSTEDYTTEEKTKLSNIKPGANASSVAFDNQNGKLRQTIDGTTTDVMTFDSTPTSGSKNVPTSNGVFDALSTKVDKVTGKGLSTEDYTTVEKSKLSGIASGANASSVAFDNQNGKLRQTINGTTTDVMTFDSTPTSGSKNVPTSNGVFEALSTKVDKVTGKGLSTNDYTTEEKTKLSNIEPGANNDCKNKFNFDAWKDVPVNPNQGSQSHTNDGAITLTVNSNNDSCFTAYGISGTYVYPEDAIVPVQEGKAYTFSFEVGTIPSGAEGQALVFKNGQTASTDIIANTLKFSTGGTKSVNFTAPVGCTFVTIRFDVYGAGRSITYSDIMIREAVTSDSYVPYAPSNRELYESKADLSLFAAMSQAEYDALVTKDKPIYFIYD